LPAEKKTEIEGKINAVREALKGSDSDAIKVAYDDLQNKFQSVSEELYKQAASAAGPAGGAGPGPQASGGPEAAQEKKADGDVVDAEFEVVDEDKKK
jgi:molecular chaperone DnaK